MADGATEYALMSSLRTLYPNVPMKDILRVINTCKRDEDKCKQLLEEESVKYPANDLKQVLIGIEHPSANNDVRIQELHVSHEPAATKPYPLLTKPTVPERHVTTLERSVVNVVRPHESKVPTIPKSISCPNQEFSTGVTTYLPPGSQTAPTDFTPFFQGIQNTTSIPNITCKAYNANPPDNINKSMSSSGGSPGEQRRPVKVINIPAGSLSGGSVSPAGGAPLNSRHFRMHFGDTGGTCTVQPNPASIQRYGSTPNVNQHYRSEYHTEASVPQSIHSSSIVVSTASHGNQSVGRRLSGETEVCRPPANPFHFNPNASAEYQPSPGAYVWEDGRPLSTPIQASSPGISHSRPVYMKDISVDYSHPPRSYNEAAYPLSGPSYNYMQHGINYGTPINSDYNANAAYKKLTPAPQEQNYTHFSQPNQNHQGYHSPPSNLNLNTPFNIPSSYNQFNPSAAVGYIPQVGVSQPPRPYGHYPSHNLPGLSSNASLPRSPNPGLTHPRLSNRTSSSESDHHDVDSIRASHFSSMGSRVSSQSSVGSDSSMRGDMMEKSRSGSTHEGTEADYIRALLQHQRNCLQKLKDKAENTQHQLLDLRSDVSQLEGCAIDSQNNMHRSFPSPSDITKLCEQNRRLQTDIQLFVNEIEMYKSGHTPLNNINPLEQQNFYANMPTGQQDCSFAEPSLAANRSSSPSRSPPPRPPPPIPVRQRSTEPPPVVGTSDIFSRVPPVPPPQPVTNSGDSEEGEQWSCSACTFQNHPALKKCEMCELERFPEPRVPPRGVITQHLPTALPQRPAATATSEWVGGVQHRPGHPQHQHHRAGT